MRVVAPRAVRIEPGRRAEVVEESGHSNRHTVITAMQRLLTAHADDRCIYGDCVQNDASEVHQSGTAVP